MQYSDLLKRLTRHRIEQIGRLTVGNDSTVYLGRREQAVFPFPVEFHSFYAPAGENDFWLDPEEVAALLRRFEINMDQF